MEPICIGQHTRTHNNFLAVTSTRRRLTNSCNYHNNLHNRRKASTVRNQTEVLRELVLETALERISLEDLSISVDSLLRSLPKEVVAQEMFALANYHLCPHIPAQTRVYLDTSKLKAAQQRKLLFFESDTLIPDTAQVPPLDSPKNIAQRIYKRNRKKPTFIYFASTKSIGKV